jgi:lipopolysaccharide transport system ATP-binding protein
VFGPPDESQALGSGAPADEGRAPIGAHDAKPSYSLDNRSVVQRSGAHVQEPFFLPHAKEPVWSEIPDAEAHAFHCVAPGGVSRWAGEGDLKVVGFAISGHEGPTDRLVVLQPAVFTFFLKAERAGPFKCTYGIAIHDALGAAVARMISPVDAFDIPSGEFRRVEVALNPNQLGPGEYTLGISVLEASSIEMLNSARRYDLVSRSFRFRVEIPESMMTISAAFFHSSEWSFRPVDTEQATQEDLDHDQHDAPANSQA